ncbi:MAG: 23S rRNA (uracil(1939)-C(5))-methyltransferase RlmD [Spirochaetales bacterium]|nr:23S rRNA (uracil(1939)-C(5))-methyltransferase RlmD [Spirochaetales bacterium]
MKHQPNGIIEGKLTKLGYGGQAIYKEKNTLLFVPRGLPGDVVRMKIRKIKNKYGTAEILKVLEPSPHRVSPGCHAFETGCGGCQWLHLEYASQLFWKTQILSETVKHIGRLNAKTASAIGMKNPRHYRNKLSLQCGRKGEMGFCRENSHIIVPFDICHQECRANQEVYDVLHKLRVPRTLSQIHIRCNLNGDTGLYFHNPLKTKELFQLSRKLQGEIPKLKGTGVYTGRTYTPLLGDDCIEQKINDTVFRIPFNGFFQTNYTQAQVLQRLVREALKPDSRDVIMDLYCGVGFFALDLAKTAKYVHGIENNDSAITSSFHNAKLNQLENVSFVTNDAKHGLKRFKKGSLDAMVMDPPRTGCEKAVLDEILRIRPERIVYVSCAPDTLSRDLKILVEGGYTVQGAIQPLDMFPQTFHIESVTSLTL